MTVEIKRKLKSIINRTSLLQKLVFWYLNHQADIAKRNILRRKREKANSTIKVGFIVQMPEVWDKEAPVYERMITDKRFDAWLIVVPKYDFIQKKDGDLGEECEYFLKKYPCCNYILHDKNKWHLDDSFDYIFYQRCWEEYLPEDLRSKHVIKKALICYTPYCYHGAPESTSYYQTFFRYLTNFYCCSIDQRDQVKEIGHIDARYMGFPLFDTLKYDKSLNSSNLIKVLWTPRWTDDDYLGGSTFLDYKDKILDLTGNKKVKLILRPHPLAFDKAMRDQEMTKAEVDAYRIKVMESGASFDENAMIEETFVDTDLLVTDFSSVIISFFLSGRPIIYCAKFDIDTTDIFRRILDVTYKAPDWNEVLQLVENISEGRDPLKEKREALISQLSIPHNSVEHILDDLEQSLR